MKKSKAIFLLPIVALLVGAICFFAGNLKNTSYGAVYGNGIDIEGGAKFTLSSGTIKSSRKVDYGGGVSVTNGTFIMNGGSIEGNSATYGGGVYVGSSGTFTMSGGTIKSNTATYGGAIYISSGTFNYGGGTITGEIYTNTTININKKPSSALTINYSGITTGTKIAKIASGVSCSISDFNITNLPSDTKLEIQTISGTQYLVVAAPNVTVTISVRGTGYDGSTIYNCGSVSESSLSVAGGSNCRVNGNRIIIDTTTITATANLGYEFYRWVVDGDEWPNGTSGKIQSAVSIYAEFRAAETVTVKSMAPWTSGRLYTDESTSRVTETTVTVPKGSKIEMEQTGSSGSLKIGDKRVYFECGSNLICDGYFYPVQDPAGRFTIDTISPVTYQVSKQSNEVNGPYTYSDVVFATIYLHFRAQDTSEFEKMQIGTVKEYPFSYDDLFTLLFLHDYWGTCQLTYVYSYSDYRENIEALYYYYLARFPNIKNVPLITNVTLYDTLIEQMIAAVQGYLGNFTHTTSGTSNFKNNMYKDNENITMSGVDFFFYDYYQNVGKNLGLDTFYNIYYPKAFFNSIPDEINNFAFANWGVSPYAITAGILPYQLYNNSSLSIYFPYEDSRYTNSGLGYHKNVYYRSGVEPMDFIGSRTPYQGWTTYFSSSNLQRTQSSYRSGTITIVPNIVLRTLSFNERGSTSTPLAIYDLAALTILMSRDNDAYLLSFNELSELVKRGASAFTDSNVKYYAQAMHALGLAKKILIPSSANYSSQSTLIKILTNSMRAMYPYFGNLGALPYYYYDDSSHKGASNQLAYYKVKKVERILPISTTYIMPQNALPSGEEEPEENELQKEQEREWVFDTNKFTSFPERRKRNRQEV